jgi:hypothetical protein
MRGLGRPRRRMGPRGHGRARRRRILSVAIAMRARRNLLADDSGQTFVEWLGAIAFIVVLVGLLVAAAPGIGDRIANLITDLIDALAPS